MPEPQCHAKTKAGKLCRNRALPNDVFCAIHRKVPPPPGVWKSIREGIATAADIATVLSGLEVVYHVIEFILKHHSHFTNQHKIGDQHYLRLVSLVGGDYENQQAIDSAEIDWAEAYRLYVAARQIAENSRPVVSSDSALFEDFDEWFMELTDLQQSAAANAIEELDKQQMVGGSYFESMD